MDAIRAERQRQIEVEGYVPEHDAQHGRDKLVQAAIAYLLGSESAHLAGGRRTGTPGALTWWPWEPEKFKLTPENRARELAKAGALIAAAIDVELAELRSRQRKLVDITASYRNADPTPEQQAEIMRWLSDDLDGRPFGEVQERLRELGPWP